MSDVGFKDVEFNLSRFFTLCSSSSGNSTYIGHCDGGILIDAGTNAKRLTEALLSVSVSPGEIKAIFITHEHTDHIGALRVFASRYSIPVYASEETLKALEKTGVLSGAFDSFAVSKAGECVCGMQIIPFETSHDCAGSCGYTVLMPDERKISVLTDTGFVTDDAAEKVSGSDLILLESNYDEEMLGAGPYPQFLKQRILSDKGHLSNSDCAQAACRFVNSGTTRLVLGHISRENNTPAAALAETRAALGEMNAVEGEDYIISAAPPGTGEKAVIF